ncbi:AmmeMemoRadiSam system radical SAM enzyme, partial [Candidatus Woesearchaeota archaeon]|nr:AmmeMemoRadiSam system radical SAM enzyme [Candidatus Woesearchaeota archaeon]
LAYGNPCAVHVDPIEKKPLLHFLPSTTSFSIAAAGCTYRCLGCQNWEISQSRPEDTQNMDMMPEAVVANALKSNCASIAYTYSEPSAFYEYMLDTSRLARQKNVKNVWVTNGSLNEKPLKDLCKVLDAANIDLKSFKEDTYREYCSGKLQTVLDTLKTLKEEKVWFEVTNLVVPSWTDDINMIRDMCRWLVSNIGKDYPLHFSRFSPLYKLTHLPQTPIRFLEQARQTAMDEGLDYVYIGNVPGTDYANTYCPKCEKLIIQRVGYTTGLVGLQDGFCKFCGQKISGVWK